MPRFRIVHTPLLKMKHQLRANNVQKLTKGMASMGAPLSETSTLTMKYDIAIHIPMTTDCSISSYLILCFGYRVALIKSKFILATLIEFIYAVTKTPSAKQQWYLTVKVIAHKNVYLPQVMLFFCRFDNQHPAFTRQVLYLKLSATYAMYTSLFALVYSVLLKASSSMEVTSSFMLYTIKLTMQTTKDTCIQRCYIAYKGVIYRCFLYSLFCSSVGRRNDR